MLGYNLFKLQLHYPWIVPVNLAWGYGFIKGWQLPTTHTPVYPTPDSMGSSNLCQSLNLSIVICLAQPKAMSQAKLGHHNGPAMAQAGGFAVHQISVGIYFSG